MCAQSCASNSSRDTGKRTARDVHEPVTAIAGLAGLASLGQHLSLAELFGIALVTVARRCQHAVRQMTPPLGAVALGRQSAECR